MSYNYLVSPVSVGRFSSVPRGQVRLRCRADRPQHRGAHSESDCDQPRHCLADHADDSVGPTDSGTAPAVVFSDVELQVLCAYSKKALKPPSTLGDMVRLVARIGGYLGRANDPAPGHQLMWRGYSQLQLMCEGFTLRE